MSIIRIATIAAALLLFGMMVDHRSDAKELPTCTMQDIMPATSGNLQSEYPSYYSVRCTADIQIYETGVYSPFFEHCKAGCIANPRCRQAVSQWQLGGSVCVFFSSICTELGCPECIDRSGKIAVKVCPGMYNEACSSSADCTGNLQCIDSVCKCPPSAPIVRDTCGGKLNFNDDCRTSPKNCAENLLCIRNLCKCPADHYNIGNKCQRNCDPGWTRFSNGNCYISIGQKMNYTDAINYCKQMSAILAMSKTRPDGNELLKITQPGTWIGLDDIDHEGTFKWIDGDRLPYYRGPWAAGEPNGNKPGKQQDCVVNNSDKQQWYDVPCESLFFFACEKTAQHRP